MDCIIDQVIRSSVISTTNYYCNDGCIGLLRPALDRTPGLYEAS
jgi:hypothetical protein